MEQIWTSSENTMDVGKHSWESKSLYSEHVRFGQESRKHGYHHTIVVSLKIQLQVQRAPNVCNIQKQSGTSNELATYRPPHPVITTF